jgi:hypothetical protein
MAEKIVTRNIKNTQYAVTVDVLQNETDLKELKPEAGVLIYWKNALFIGDGREWKNITSTIKPDLNDGTRI